MSRFLSDRYLILFVSIFIVATGNFSFFTHAVDIYPVAENFIFVASLALVLILTIVVELALVGLVITPRVAATVFLLTACIAGYFADHFGSVIDADMLRNTSQTNFSEASDLLTWGLAWRIFFFAVLPIALVWRAPIQRANRLREMRYSLQLAVAAALVLGAIVALQGNYFASFFREHKSMRYYANPVYPIYSSIKFVGTALRPASSTAFERLTSFSNVPADEHTRELIIVVVGETARADHFSLNGYSRKTNPYLEQEKNIVSFSRISSCGTATAVSVPCMFSLSGREHFDQNRSEYTENVVDVLNEAGVNVLWRDNNSSSKGVADRVQYENFQTAERNPACDIECRDVGVLSGLQQYIDTRDQGDILIVLHQMGSHGPAYFKRYPPEFETFKPACQSAELSTCSPQEIVNAYDNTLVYTDYFLSKVIELLKANTPRFETAMFYVSDHGESLGENGIYLHGLPYFMAPQAQTHVPLIAWIGETSDIDYPRTHSLKDVASSHDAFGISLLHAFEIDADLPAEFKSRVPLIVLKNSM